MFGGIEYGQAPFASPPFLGPLVPKIPGFAIGDVVAGSWAAGGAVAASIGFGRDVAASGSSMEDVEGHQ